MVARKPYTPIPCSLHSQYELAILRQKPVRLRWLDESGVVRAGTVVLSDLFAHQGEEVLVAEDEHGGELRLRLDCIVSSDLS